jgi:hypothetical protein
MGWPDRIALLRRSRLLCLVALSACVAATEPEEPVTKAETIYVPGGAKITITQGCPIDVSTVALKEEDRVAFAINDTSLPSPAIYHGALSPSSYIILMEAGSYEPNVIFSCTADSLHSFIRIDGVAPGSIAVRPVRNWADVAGQEALDGYARNLRDCKENGPRWSGIWIDGFIERVPSTGGRVAGEGFGGCKYHIGQMSQALRLTVGQSRFIISKIVDDLYIGEIK